MRSFIAFLLMLCMIAAGLSIGAYRGWRDERAWVEENAEMLSRLISARIETAYNIITVAGRHLPKDDPDMMQMMQCRDMLAGASSMPGKAAAYQALSGQMETMLKKLAALDSVRQDERDLMYAENYLPQMLAETDAATAQAQYNQAADAFNQKLSHGFSGRIAGFFGVWPAEAFIVP